MDTPWPLPSLWLTSCFYQLWCIPDKLALPLSSSLVCYFCQVKSLFHLLKSFNNSFLLLEFTIRSFFISISHDFLSIFEDIISFLLFEDFINTILKSFWNGFITFIYLLECVISGSLHIKILISTEDQVPIFLTQRINVHHLICELKKDSHYLIWRLGCIGSVPHNSSSYTDSKQ